jgi:sulfite reductase (NADPH) flavoprotein alpha-component
MKLEPTSGRDAFIPESAPFTSEQRAWLNGFVAGLFAGLAQSGPNQSASAGSTTAKASLAILYGSQTGTAEQLAKRLAKEAGQRGYEPRVLEMSAFAKIDLKEEKQLLILTSTWGDGDPPDNALAFWNHLNSDQAPRLDHLEFSVLALGDKNYSNFCGAGKKFDVRLEQLGAKRIHPCAECDVDYEAPAQVWINALWPVLKANSVGGGKITNDQLISPPTESPPTGYSKTNPFPARLLANRNLNGPGSTKETRHFEISLQGSGLSYEVGDALGVMPANCPALAEELLAALRCDGEEMVRLANGKEVSLCAALREHFQITRLSQTLLAAFAERSKDAALAELLQPANKSELDKVFVRAGNHSFAACPSAGSVYPRRVRGFAAQTATAPLFNLLEPQSPPG